MDEQRIIISKSQWLKATRKEGVSILNMHISLHHHMTFRDLLTLLTGVKICCGQLHVIGWEETSGPVELSFPPVRIVLV